MEPVAPEKHYFKIGEVAKLLAVKPHVLRYWESEFRWLKPEKSTTNQRLYSRRDVDLLRLVQSLLHQKRFTIDGARKFLEECRTDWIGGLQRLSQTETSGVVPVEARKQLEQLQNEVARARHQLDKAEAELRECKDKYRRTSIELLQLRKSIPDLLGTLSLELATLRDLARTSSQLPPRNS